MKKYYLLLLYVLISPMLVFSQALTWSTIADSIPKMMEKDKIPGLQIAVFNSDSVLFQGTWGVSNVDSQKAANDSSVFRLGSTSKHFVGALALILQERGMFSLDEKLSEALPNFKYENKWKETNPITLRHLMEHTAGFDDLHFHEYAVNDSTLSLEEGINQARYTRKSRWRLGTVSSYCNLGPALVARAIEVRTGRLYEDLVDEFIFEPLGMKNTSFFVEPEFASRMTSAHEGNPPNSTPYWHIAFRPAGSINSTATDMIKWGQVLLNDGQFGETQILAIGAVENMYTPKTTIAAENGQKTGYGLGLTNKIWSGELVVEHGGATNGHQCSFFFFPELNVGVIAMINSDQGLGLRSITSLLQKGFLPENGWKDQVKPLSKELTQEFEGLYHVRYARNSFAEGISAVFGRLRTYRNGDSLRVSALLGGNDGFLVEYKGKPYVAGGSQLEEITMVETDLGLMMESMKSVKISPLRFWGGFAWMILGAISLVVSLIAGGFFGIIALAKFFKPKIKQINTAWSLIPFLSSSPFLITLLLISGKSFTQLMSVADIGFWTLMVFVLTLSLPLLTIVHFFWVKEDYEMGGWKRAWLNGVGFLSTFSITIFASQYGWIGFRIWADM